MVSHKTLTLTSCYQLLTLGVVVLAALIVWREGALGVLLGGGLMAVNFWALCALAARVIQGGRRRLLYGLALALKLAVTLAAVAFILSFFKAHAIGFVLGMATLFVGMALAVAHQSLTANRSVST